MRWSRRDLLAIMLGTIAGALPCRGQGCEVVGGIIVAMAPSLLGFAQLLRCGRRARPRHTRNTASTVACCGSETGWRVERGHIVRGLVVTRRAVAAARAGKTSSAHEGVVTTCIAVLPVGIAIGSGLAARESRPDQLRGARGRCDGFFALVTEGVA